MNEYEAKAREFCEKTGTVITWEYESFRKHFPDDKDKRDVWTFTIERNGRSYSGTLGNSLHDFMESCLQAKGGPVAFLSEKDKSELRANWHRPKTVWQEETINRLQSNPSKTPKQPSAYSLLAGLQKWEVGSFDNFCAEFGYNDRPLADYPKVTGIYQAVCEEYAAVLRLWPEPEVRAELEEIN